MDKQKVGLLPKIITVIAYVVLLAPMVVVILASFSPTSVIMFPPKEFSLQWYQNIFSSSTKFADGLVNSLKIAAVATAIDLVLGVTASLSVTKYRFKGSQALLSFFTSPMFIPSITFAFVLLQLFSSASGMGSFTKILLGHIVIILPYIIRNTVSVLSVFDWTLEEAAASLGAGPFKTFFKVTLPNIRGGLMAGGLLSFLYSFDEAVISGFLTSAKFVTLPIRIMNYMEFSFDPTLAAISTVLILASLLIMVLMERLVGLDLFV